MEGGMAIDVMTKPHQLIASDRVEGTAVRRPNGDMIGHIERLMIDKVTGKVSYAILSFGGFLGIGANLIPLPWGRLRYNTRFEAYELDIDDEELKRAPSFRADKDFDWGDRDKEAELHRYYGMPPYWGGFCFVRDVRRLFLRSSVASPRFRAKCAEHLLKCRVFPASISELRENRYVSQICHRRRRGFRVAGQCRVRAKSEHKQCKHR